MSNFATGGDSVLVPVGALELSVEEVRQLWSFVHGDIMDGAMRRYLRASLGLCPRHSWGHAVVEIELWQAGAGQRAGHQPFDVAVLHEDLLEFAAGELQRPVSWFHPGAARCPVQEKPCRICVELHGTLPQGVLMGYANSDSGALAAEANLLLFTASWCRETRPVWDSRICPRCAGGTEGSRVLMCRRHLAELGPMSRADGLAVAGRLLEIRRRLLRLIDSMTDRGQPASPGDNSSWIEALGWFAGWGLAQYLSTAPER
ncbi:MAG: hypothetical protein M3017_09495 [Actinomycetota bacterium]|nr:hypothetical protein [Actinomycetota bacterium]